MSALPLDILDTIARNLQHNTAALKAACLVARQWQLVFQRVLFSHVQIKDEISSNNFLAAIQDQSSVASLIRSLELQFTAEPTDTLFVKLPLLQSLSICARRTLSPKFCTALRPALRSQHLTSLTLQDVKWFPLQILNEAVALEHFSSIGTSYHAGGDKALANDGQSQARLHTLSLSAMGSDKHELIKWLTHPGCILDLRGVKSLGFRADYGFDSHVFRRLLSRIPSTLEHLNYQAPGQSTSTTDSIVQSLLNAFNLTRFTDLRSLTIYTYLNTVPGFSKIDLLPWCVAFVSTLSTPSKLESLRIRCSWTFSRSTSDPSSSNSRLQRWDDFDDLLSSTAFSKLGQVTLYLAFAGGSTSLDRSKNFISRRLPRLVRQGKLRVVASQDLGY
ncbi:hypothetical protein BDN72DRAFT_877996 [Pluteus cervinus]|uniref:Uncharacterized protein n=1 Tax=Pluteus cervinus TaxID=181527 RepID=A0ACD3AYS9_9AGAR|nr:hypothetical protein BDN72DRAFT_877996 [Pluteus cervinus]